MAGDFDVIYQMPFVHDGVRGVADFIERIVDNETGTVRYEPVDAKLAAAAEARTRVAAVLLRRSNRSAHRDCPVDLRIWLGSGPHIESVRLANVQAYWRRLRRQLAAVMAADPADVATEPERCTHCQFCEFSAVCEAQWRNDDSLLFVANILKADRQTLVAHGHPTMAALAACDQPVDGLRLSNGGGAW